MIKLNEIYALLDSKINSDESECFEIIHASEPYATSGIWYFKVSMLFGDKKEKTEIENPNNLCIYNEIYKYLLNKYGEEVDIILPSGLQIETSGVEIFVKNLYVRCIPVGFSSEIYNWVAQLKK